MLKLPKTINNILEYKPYICDNTGLSGSGVYIYDDYVLKIENINSRTDNTIAVMQWLENKLPVPEIIRYEKENGKCYLLMSRIKGKMACDEYYMERPELLCKLLAEALKGLWSVDIRDCPVDISVEHDLKKIESRINAGTFVLDNIVPHTFGENGFDSPVRLLEWLKENKPLPEPVLSHGDLCLPNIFFENDILSGFIDLGNCGISDKWKDIAICCRSLQYNFDGVYGGKAYTGFHPDMFFAALGIKPDYKKLNYYILLDELYTE